MAWTAREPRVDYSAADATRDLMALVFEIALKNVDSKESKEKNRVSMAVERLSSLERRRNQYEVAFLENQAKISSYVGKADNLQDLYKTGQGKKLGSSIEQITADLYEEPLKYYKQAMTITQNQIDVLNPAILSSVDQLAKLAQAKDFLTKGIGAAFEGGVKKQIETWGPEDFTQAMFKEKFYPKEEMSKELQLFFKTHKADPKFISGLEAKKLKSEWDIEQRSITREGVQRSKDIHAVTMGQMILPGTAEINRNLERMNRYNPMINESNIAMLSASIGWTNMIQGKKQGKQSLMEQGQAMYDAETFRIGLLFNPAAAPGLGIGPDEVRNLSTEQLSEKYEKFLSLKLKDPKRIRVLQINELGKEIYHENSQARKFESRDVKSGIAVPAYNDRDELIAQSYMNFRAYKNVNPTMAEKYREDIKYILGVDLRHEGTVRTILKEFFRTNFLEGAIGVKGGYSKIKTENLTPYQGILAGEWMDIVKHKYYYDIIEDKWIDKFVKMTDAEGNIKLVPQYE